MEAITGESIPCVTGNAYRPAWLSGNEVHGRNVVQIKASFEGMRSSNM